jgi:hypothetical protein
MGGGVLDHRKPIYPVFSDLIKGGMMFIVATHPFYPKKVYWEAEEQRGGGRKVDRLKTEGC